MKAFNLFFKTFSVFILLLVGVNLIRSVVCEVFNLQYSAITVNSFFDKINSLEQLNPYSLQIPMIELNWGWFDFIAQFLNILLKIVNVLSSILVSLASIIKNLFEIIVWLFTGADFTIAGAVS